MPPLACFASLFKSLNSFFTSLSSSRDMLEKSMALISATLTFISSSLAVSSAVSSGFSSFISGTLAIAAGETAVNKIMMDKKYAIFFIVGVGYIMFIYYFIYLNSSNQKLDQSRWYNLANFYWGSFCL